jgi:CheY-like chemotaxis protein
MSLEEGPRILCVEDNKDAREMIRAMLSAADPNYSITAVGTAAEALHLRGSFDLYILDISLPGMDGISLCRRLRDRGVSSPIMFFSAMVQPSDKEYCLAAGANEFLVKPGDLDRFTPTVARLLNGEGPQKPK